MKASLLSAMSLLCLLTANSARAEGVIDEALKLNQIVTAKSASMSCTEFAKQATLEDFSLKYPDDVNVPSISNVQSQRDPRGIGGTRLFVNTFTWGNGGGNGVALPSSIAFEIKSESPCRLEVLDFYVHSD